jgi:hypothetical protein
MARSPALRAGAALLATLVLGACGGTVDFTVDRSLVVDSTVGGGTTSMTYDLAAASAAWKERKHVSSVTVESAEVTVTAVDAANAATDLSGTVWLLPDGVTDTASGVEVGSFPNQPVTVGTSVAMVPNAALDALLTSALRGSGRLTVVASGVATPSGSRLACTLRVVIAARMSWKL